MKTKITVSMSIQRLAQMRDALMQLEAGERVEHSNGGGARMIRDPFELGALRLDIARNLNRIRLKLEAFDLMRSDFIRECSDGKDAISKEADPEAWAKFEPVINARLTAEEDIDLIPLPQDKLNLDKNPIPILALAALDSIIT